MICAKCGQDTASVMAIYEKEVTDEYGTYDAPHMGMVCEDCLEKIEEEGGGVVFEDFEPHTVH